VIIVRTPLRLSFVGGGSDIPAFYKRSEGRVVSCAMDKYVYVIVKSRFDDKIYINYSQKECVDRVSEIRHDLVREAMLITGVESGVEITTLADVPSEGSGLGSSSSITVALLHALFTYKNKLVTAEDLARLSCDIEISRAQKPIGRQDQYAAAYGGVNEFVFHEDDSVTRLPVSVSDSVFRRFSSSLLLYFTGITRKADVILSEQSKNAEDAGKFDFQRRMAELVGPFRSALETGDIEECGRLLDENWRMKQQMAKGISNEKIEAMYGAAKNASPAGSPEVLPAASPAGSPVVSPAESPAAASPLPATRPSQPHHLCPSQ